MIAMLRLQFIIFSLIGIGFVTRKKGIVSREGQRSITDLVINVVLPCNIVTSFVQEPRWAWRRCACCTPGSPTEMWKRTSRNA